MMLFLKKLLGWILKIPVLFAHFPGPTLMLVAIVALSAGGGATWLTHKAEAGARAELAIELANAKAQYAELRTKAAESRAEIVSAAGAEQRAIDIENQRAWRAQLAALAESMNDKAAIAALSRSIQELHRDPAFDCRRLPLPDSYVRGMWLTGESPGAAGR